MRIVLLLFIVSSTFSQIKIENFNSFKLIHAPYLEAPSFKFDKRLSPNLYIKFKDSSLNSQEIKYIKLFFNDPGKQFSSLKNLRKNTELHDFIFYYGAKERFKTKEYRKARYNLKKANSLGLYNKKMKQIAIKLENEGLKCKLTVIAENEQELRVLNNYWSELQIPVEGNIKNDAEYSFAAIVKIFLNNPIYFVSILFLFVFITGYYAVKRKEAFIDSFTENESSVETDEKELKKNIENSRKTIDFEHVLLENKKNNLLDIVNKKVTKLEDSLSRYQEENDDNNDFGLMYDENPRDNIFEYEKIQFNSGELELAMNLQKIKKRTDSNRNRYERIKPLYRLNKSTIEIARELGLAVTEVEMYLNFSKVS